MDEEIRRLRTEARRPAGATPPTRVRYPDSSRRAAVAIARRRQERGGSVAHMARELGVSEPTLTKWLRPPAPPVLRPVAVTPAPGPERRGVARPVLITPNGVRVKGLDGDTLVAVLQALG